MPYEPNYIICRGEVFIDNNPLGMCDHLSVSENQIRVTTSDISRGNLALFERVMRENGVKVNLEFRGVSPVNRAFDMRAEGDLSASYTILSQDQSGDGFSRIEFTLKCNKIEFSLK